MNIQEILKLIPHRYPFLLIDRVESFTAGESLRAIKNVTVNEPHFTGHWPGNPVMPGVLIVEAMAQATAILAFKTMEVQGTPRSEDGIFYFAGVDNVRFKQPVVPGDQLLIETKLGKSKSGIWMCSATATVDNKVVCTADLIAAYREAKA